MNEYWITMKADVHGYIFFEIWRTTVNDGLYGQELSTVTTAIHINDLT